MGGGGVLMEVKVKSVLVPLVWGMFLKSVDKFHFD
jgi:hypothetical protein